MSVEPHKYLQAEEYSIRSCTKGCKVGTGVRGHNGCRFGGGNGGGGTGRKKVSPCTHPTASHHPHRSQWATGSATVGPSAEKGPQGFRSGNHLANFYCFWVWAPSDKGFLASRPPHEAGRVRGGARGGASQQRGGKRALAPPAPILSQRCPFPFLGWNGKSGDWLLQGEGQRWGEEYLPFNPYSSAPASG